MIVSVFRQGQRVFAPAEPHLGLGLVSQESGRRFTVSFPKAQEERTYSQDTEALVRFRAKPGDKLKDSQGQEHLVESVVERGDGVAYRTRAGHLLEEAALAQDLGHPDPFAELARGRPGSPADFARRLRAHKLKALGRAQPHRGLGAARVQLLPHQLYVTERVARMWRPRALLADEVGLGKTVEAGLVAVRMAALGRVSSMAVVAPRPLVGQWLAEFYRRFARPLTLFDVELEELPEDMLIAADDLEFLPPDFARDLLIVDEAHHYADDEALKGLTARSRAVLLLSATPSLGGQDRLFSLLHLLDPMRYPDPDSLAETGQRWLEVAQLARAVEAGAGPAEIEGHLRRLYPQEGDLLALAHGGQNDELLERLVDRHGLGRSLLRNRRRRLHGLFPGRTVTAHPLGREQKLETFIVEFLKDLAGRAEKTLVMVESPEAVARYARILQKRSKLLVARFDESMSLLERDRQAAWFNRTGNTLEGDGADVLICSEIGGEGRNFQVAHHLLLLDLPAHPDRLEQRIGRLDRIGQTHLVEVHVPLPAADKATSVRFAWLDRGLDAFRRPLTEGQRAYDRFAEELSDWEKRGPTKDFDTWCDAVRKVVDHQQAEAEAAIDPLVDRMSFSEEDAVRLRDEAEREQTEMALLLEDELQELLDSLGIVMEPRSEARTFSIKPGDMMFVEALPGMPPEGCVVTFDRPTANSREDLDFLHFEHRLVQGTLDLILDEGVGRATAARWRGAPKTTIAFQFLLLWEADADAQLGIDRFMPAQALVLTGDMAGGLGVGNQLPGTTQQVPSETLERLGPDVVETLLARTVDLRPQLLERAHKLLEGASAKLLTEARRKADAFFDAESARLEHLHRTDDPGGEALYQEAFARLGRFQQDCRAVLDRAEWRFDAVRIILCQEANS